MEFKTLDKLSHSEIIDAFEKAFGDYAVSFKRSEIASMLERRGFCAGLSFAALEHGEIVSFILNGFGNFNGQPSCYDCGTATMPEYRGRGLAGKLFAYSVPKLKEAGVLQYVLEVLCDNSPAIAVYEKNSFKTSRCFDCFRQNKTDLTFKKSIPEYIEIRTADSNIMQNLTKDAFEFTPSWQNSIESLQRGAGNLLFFGAYHDNEPIAICVSDPESGDISLLAVEPAYRRKGIATALMGKAVGAATAPGMKVLNIDKNAVAVQNFLSAVNFRKALSQFEMTREL